MFTSWLQQLGGLWGSNFGHSLNQQLKGGTPPIDFYEWYNPLDWRILGFDHDDVEKMGPFDVGDYIKLGIVGYFAFWAYSEYRSPTRKSYSMSKKYGRRGFKYGQYSSG